MEASGSAIWIFDSIGTLNDSDILSNDTTLLENVTNIQLTCEHIQEIFGKPLPIPMSIENMLRYVQAVYFIFSPLCLESLSISLS